ncbi:MAG TPA: hypothetical protein VGO60_06810 [Iamia sp.]|nr:hypothetical protein [Iamia sp.]
MKPIDRLFRDREAGRIVIAQWPNVSLGIFLVAAAVRRLADPAGTAGTVVSVVATGALLGWATDEVVRGVNPWRRILGALVGGATLVGLVASAA